MDFDPRLSVFFHYLSSIDVKDYIMAAPELSHIPSHPEVKTKKMKRVQKSKEGRASPTSTDIAMQHHELSSRRALQQSLCIY